MGAFSTANPIFDQSVHFGIGFEAWTYPWLLPLFWIYQATATSKSFYWLNTASPPHSVLAP